MTWVKGLIFTIGVVSSICLLTFLAWIIFPIPAKPNPNYYRAAVVEAFSYGNTSMPIKEVIHKYLETYEKAVNLAASNGVDIIVFRESSFFIHTHDYFPDRMPLIGTLAEDIPDPLEGDYNPCEQNLSEDNFLLRNLSCMAKSGGMFLVANVVDYKKCRNNPNTTDKNATSNCSDEDECPEDGYYIYNTNVVFNRAGKLIIRYHKKHLYHEAAINASKCPDNVYFETDFGNFTTTICFDMLNSEATEAVERFNVSNLVYSLYWTDNTPFFSFSGFLQHAFAFYNKINVLSANSNRPGTGTSGSGIFSASNGALIFTKQPDGLTKVLISNVPKDPKRYTINLNDLNRRRYVLKNNVFHDVNITDDYVFEDECERKVIGPPEDMIKDYRCSSNNLHAYEFTKLEGTENTVSVCNEEFCCELFYNRSSDAEDYFLAASVSDELFKQGVESCFVARCKSENGQRCSSFFLKSETIFLEADLKGTFRTKYVYPFIIDSNVRLTEKNKWVMNGTSQITYKNSKDNISLLFLGLYGRDFASND